MDSYMSFVELGSKYLVTYRTPTKLSWEVLHAIRSSILPPLIEQLIVPILTKLCDFYFFGLTRNA